MKSNKPTTLPPVDRRCLHHDGINGTRCPNWARAGAAFCPKHEPTASPAPPMAEAPLRQAQDAASARLQATPKAAGERIEHMVDTMFLIQEFLATAIKTKVQAQELEILSLAELSKGYIANALNITRTMQAKQTLEVPQNDWSLILAEISNELEQEA